VNCKNANQELGFDKFAECDYNLHWSFSNFNRTLMAAGQIARLPLDSLVLELGAGSSDLENVVKKNFKRDDIKFTRVDGDKRYESDKTITVFDITSNEFNTRMHARLAYDCVVFMEVIEHLDKDFAPTMFERIASWLVPEGMLLFTTPTPPYEGMYEDRVWPTDHKEEFTNSEIYGIINKGFKINKEIGWSLEEREYNKLLESASPEVMQIYAKLRGAFPESYIRAIISCIAPVENNRQIFMVCKKRRMSNGRFTPPR
jgi:hypothetical protein